MTIVNIENSKTEETKQERTYKIGDFFLVADRDGYDHGLYVLSQVGNGIVCPISLEDGNRWRSPIKVDSAYKIAEKDLRNMFGCSYKLTHVPHVNISYSL